ncbi:hypothetical protein DYQ86_11750 [Acidobacteria bacterium AB60]|nr:hypothetical protein DYQ86_11750 [Acidobacteria bacterium AB60]
MCCGGRSRRSSRGVQRHRDRIGCSVPHRLVACAGILKIDRGSRLVARIITIADDLTGAADCAAPSVAHGCKAVVLLHSLDLEREAWPEADLLSIDLNTRCLSPERAAEVTTHFVRLYEMKSAESSEYVLFKKIDSTLRGNIAHEIAALLQVRRSSESFDRRLSILLAPALPEQGRTTVCGRLLVHGRSAEKTDIWRFEPRNPPSSIPQLLSDAALSCALIDIEMVRSGLKFLRRAILEAAKRSDVVLCDAVTDSDLRAIVAASLRQPGITSLVGSAGLACHIPQSLGIISKAAHHQGGFAIGPTLFVVGSASSVSRQQSELLSAMPEVASYRTTPAVLHDSLAIRTQISQSLQSGRDVLLSLQEDGQRSKQGDRLRGFSLISSQCAPFIGGLVATGGETARAILDGLGIHRLRVLGQVDPGMPFSVAECWQRPLPVITKAGAFGAPQALLRCLSFLRELQRAPAPVRANDPLLSHES